MAQIKTEPLTDYYEVKEELGRGRFAVVKRCVKISSGEVYAAKCIRKARAGRRGREQLLLEIDILHTSNHPKLVKLYDVFETRSEMILILEYAAGGDLHKHCLEIESVRTEKEICFLIYQIVEAASYLHDNHVVHLDLKPENILLNNDNKFPEIRLIDFGLSRRVDLPYSQYDIVGTPEYVAPEVLSYEAIKTSADLWSIGVVSYVLLSGISPFAGDDVMETYANIANVDFDFDAEEFDDISDEAKDFIESLLIKDPTERLTTRECLEHPWLIQMSAGVQREDIEAALIAEEAFERLIREESISRLESENGVFSSETDTQGDVEQVMSSDELSDMTTDDADDADCKDPVFLEERSADEGKPVTEETQDDEVSMPVTVQEEKTEQAPSSEVLEAETKADLPEPKVSFTGGFDIDSLLCQDDDNGNETNAVQEEEENSLLSQSDVDVNVDAVEPKEIVNGISNGVELNLNEVETDHLNNGEIEKVCEKSAEKEETPPEPSSPEHLRVGVDFKKQLSSDAVLTSRKASTSLINESHVAQGAESKISLNKTKSVDDSLLAGKRKTSDVAKGNKLGAHLEKLSKAGLNLKEDSDRKPHQNSAKRSDSHESKDDLERKETPLSSRSSGSSTPTSGRATPDSICFVDQNKQPAQKLPVTKGPKTHTKIDETKTTTDDPTKVQNESESEKSVSNGRMASVSPRKISSEKSAYPKKQSLGVPQGIAAQMASKFSSNAEKASTPSPSKINKVPGQISNRKYWEGATPEAIRSEAAKSKRGSLKIDKSLFSNAVKVAKGEASQDQTVELERKSQSPKNSPKMIRSKNTSEMQVKDRAEQYMKAATDSDNRNKAQVASPRIEKKLMKLSDQVDDRAEPKMKKASSKENILQKFEKQNKKENDGALNQVKVQPKGLQFSFNLQAGNKFKIKDVNSDKSVSEANGNKGASKVTQEGRKTVTFDASKDTASRRKIEPVTIPKSFSGMLEEDDTFGAQGNEHIEHTAIGALATMPRTPLRELRSKSRTSRDGGSPSSPRKAYRRLYVTHVKGSKSEQETEQSEDIADIKTKMEKDELKVELLVKFGTL